MFNLAKLGKCKLNMAGKHRRINPWCIVVDFGTSGVVGWAGVGRWVGGLVGCGWVCVYIYL